MPRIASLRQSQRSRPRSGRFRHRIFVGRSSGSGLSAVAQRTQNRRVVGFGVPQDGQGGHGCASCGASAIHASNSAMEQRPSLPDTGHGKGEWNGDHVLRQPCQHRRLRHRKLPNVLSEITLRRRLGPIGQVAVIDIIQI